MQKPGRTRQKFKHRSIADVIPVLLTPKTLAQSCANVRYLTLNLGFSLLAKLIYYLADLLLIYHTNLASSGLNWGTYISCDVLINVLFNICLVRVVALIPLSIIGYLLVWVRVNIFSLAIQGGQTFLTAFFIWT